MKKLCIIIAAALALALAACGGSKREAAGPLTLNEIAKYESLYLKGTDALLEGLGLTEKDVDSWGSSLFWELPEPRSISGKDFDGTLMLSRDEPHGLIGVGFRRRVSDSERKALLKSLYEEAVSLYGEPLSDPEQDEETRISKQLEKELPGGCSETWEAGEGTIVTLRLFIPGELGPLVDGVPGIGIEYRMAAAQ